MTLRHRRKVRLRGLVNHDRLLSSTRKVQKSLRFLQIREWQRALRVTRQVRSFRGASALGCFRGLGGCQRFIVVYFKLFEGSYGVRIIAVVLLMGNEEALFGLDRARTHRLVTLLPSLCHQTLVSSPSEAVEKSSTCGGSLHSSRLRRLLWGRQATEILCISCPRQCAVGFLARHLTDALIFYRFWKCGIRHHTSLGVHSDVVVA